MRDAALFRVAADLSSRFAALFGRGAPMLFDLTGPSSNGRTLVFGTSYPGSNPGGPANLVHTNPRRGSSRNRLTGYFEVARIHRCSCIQGAPVRRGCDGVGCFESPPCRFPDARRLCTLLRTLRVFSDFEIKEDSLEADSSFPLIARSDAFPSDFQAGPNRPGIGSPSLLFTRFCGISRPPVSDLRLNPAKTAISVQFRRFPPPGRDRHAPAAAGIPFSHGHRPLPPARHLSGQRPMTP